MPGLDTQMLARVLDFSAGTPGILYDLLEAPAVARALREGGAGPADLAAIPRLQGVRDCPVSLSLLCRSRVSM
jgi:hypothetical protein